MFSNENQYINDFLNENIGNIVKFKVWNTYIEVHMKDGTYVELSASDEGALYGDIVKK
jgi:hypothetical protein